MTPSVADDKIYDARERSLLTWRETLVAKLVAEGYTNEGIAKKLNISAGTVKDHLSSALAKLGFVNRVQLAVWWARR